MPLKYGRSAVSTIVFNPGDQETETVSCDVQTRVPAAWTGTVGLRATPSRLSRHGLLSPMHEFDVPSVITRTVADAALLMAILQGPVRSDLCGAGLGIGCGLCICWSGLLFSRASDLFTALYNGIWAVSLPYNLMYFCLFLLLTTALLMAIHLPWRLRRVRDL